MNFCLLNSKSDISITKIKCYYAWSYDLYLYSLKYARITNIFLVLNPHIASLVSSTKIGSSKPLGTLKLGVNQNVFTNNRERNVADDMNNEILLKDNPVVKLCM
jgi:hypothetical protein